MQKLWSYFHFQALATVSVPVTESGTGTSSGDRSWYRRQSLVPISDG